MERNLFEVWNERDSAKRKIAIERIYTKDGTFFDISESASGYEAINVLIESTLKKIPADFVFHIISPALENHNMGRLTWGLGPANGPTMGTGIDIAIFQEERILFFYVFLDKINP